MPFTPSEAYVRSILDPAANGDLDPFFSVIDPNVHWIINTEERNPTSMTGVYVRLAFTYIIIHQ